MSLENEPAKSSKRAQLAGLVGEESAALTYRGFYWQVGGLAVWIVGFTVLVAVSMLSVPTPGLAVWIPSVLLIVIELRAIQLYAKGGRAGSAYLSERTGSPIRVRGFSLQPRVWQRQIEKATGVEAQQDPIG
ncbi:MAG: hypothetical protein WA751_06230 [Candidatus Dormiibacterota bacterium]